MAVTEAEVFCAAHGHLYDGMECGCCGERKP